MRRTLLVDSDIVAFKFASAFQETFYWDGAGTTPSITVDLDGALAATEQYLAALKARLNADHLVMCLSDPKANFRNAIYPLYKSNRSGAARPQALGAIKDWFKENYETYERPELEADDCMGILSTHPKLIPGMKIIVSEDKDMQTIPGWLFNPKKDSKPRKVSRLMANRYHLTQAVTGDPVDGYPGAPGVGAKSPEVAAINEAGDVPEAWSHVMAAFGRSRETRGLSTDYESVYDDALVQARCARILRHHDFDFAAKRPRSWIPKEY